MRRIVLGLLALAAGLAATAYHTRVHWLPRGDYDGLPNRYQVRIDGSGQRAFVQASIWLDSPMLSMFDVSAVPGLPNGHADLVEDLQVRDADGDAVSVRALGQGDFEVRGGQRLQLSYAVRLEHDRFRWPAGSEEVAYRTDEGHLFRMSTLLFADGGERMQGGFEIGFELPDGWVAHTPWQTAGSALRFQAPNRREALNNVVFLGTAHAEQLQVGGVDLTLVLGRRYRNQVPLFRELLDAQMRSYQQMFGGNPLAQRYLIVINEGASGDGGAFAGSFSQFIPGDATRANRVVWGHTMAHELLHFWNGLSMVPADAQEEWFKEGVTDYLTITSMARNGLIDEALLLKRLENLPRRDVLARQLQGLQVSVREAGYDKQPNRLLVYGGGALAALALDAALREHSGERIGLPDLMREMYAEFGQPQAHYRLQDIQRIANRMAGTSLDALFASTVETTAPIDIRPALARFGLRMDSFAEEIYLARDEAAAPAERQRFAAAFAATAAEAMASAQ